MTRDEYYEINGETYEETERKMQQLFKDTRAMRHESAKGGLEDAIRARDYERIGFWKAAIRSTS